MSDLSPGALRPVPAPQGLAAYAERRLPRAGLLISGLLPSSLLFGYVAVTDGLDFRTFLTALLVLALAFATVAGLLIRYLLAWSRPMRACLRDRDAGRESAPDQLEAARRVAVRLPYRAASGSLLSWSLLYPALITWALERSGGTVPGNLAWGGLVTGTLTALTALLTYEILLKPVYAALFTDADPSGHRAWWMLSVRGRVLMAFVFTGPVWLVVTLALLSHQLAHPHGVRGLLPLGAYMVSVSMLLCALFAALIRHQLTVPLERLLTGLARIDADDYDGSLAVESNDRFGQLAYQYNHMAAGLRERRRLRQALDAYVSPEVAELAVRGTRGLVPHGERREVTVLFADLQGFSTMAEQSEAADVVTVLNQYAEQMCRCIAEEGGCVIELLGDGILAVFNAPGDVADHASAAGRAARSMVIAMEGLTQQWRALGLLRQPDQAALSIRIGINTGGVIAGNLGGRERMKFAVVGDAVNVAARLEALNKELGTRLCVSDEARSRMTADLAEGLSLHGDLPVKGRQQPVRVWTRV
ncbi:MAG: adenylate/guanylate cyclase domain-containing protein [Candidatus Sericytochromatia bacterium]|nr:adenylate/guanylate cyclase domain-containing protein [Candidatus Sericytochromatia bacterium]